MGKGSSLTAEGLLARAERVRSESRALTQKFVALRELRLLERDFRVVTRKLTMAMFGVPWQPEPLNQLLMEAEEVIVPPPPTFNNR
jgi:hypothetical protein